MIGRLGIDDLGLSRGERVLFQGLSVDLKTGEALALTGANGAGKTSLLRAVAGFIRPDAGGVRFLDRLNGDIEPETARARHIHLLGHLEGLKGARTARDELCFQTAWCGGAGIDAAVEALGLAPLLDLETRKLSAGQRRRLSLARLIAAPRALWLLDEPLAPLDARWRGVATQLMRDHLAGDGMVIAAVHDPLDLPCRTLDVGAAS
ncbi:heme ABC exporter ATP-binding protein CcmA [Brevundimonas sp.]|uniref:heme ABC exporter ATP-binding protein CcmA n=1 Tax=Brevundimonas sp. TaxID=1871086 RepID=UPI001D69DBE5|nr:heme ABC exporter ATP-binding protein CcmA [Brevundimonas sp.]MBA3999802.1 heme ABC exporter ATP-binding protein CcmA [Brevundimonas sp.]